ncbi:stress response regulator YchF/OLA1 [Candidatus Mancarchaeum acidiphilum]|uniref:Stress response regulator YchF/OLA1 n=1 Tax=Candidatus Mancarchaeum acidiphilum TaxID=1920749 RepID=A0A218NLX6_9ARCH|nr:YchF-related putative GTPase [Candidatus Mancarchaeum acidiphilum]ASI13469.1 stress response regulator YchF/OLA1 [Candidatus Mancarchaeum acidiphilum]
MLIGIIGAPNKGKSTLFSALTMHDAQVADYPFTTIDPNKGLTYVAVECPEKRLGTKCNPRNSLCVEGTRYVPVNIVDVAGLVEGASEGKGMGNQFLNDLSIADALMLVVDASGRTDSSGNPCSNCNPVDDVNMVNDELHKWLAGIIKKHIKAISRREDGIDALYEILTGMKITRAEIEDTINELKLSSSRINWDDAQIYKFAEKLIEISKPVLVVANKYDLDTATAKANVESLKENFKDVEWCSAVIEYALRKANEKGVIKYSPGMKSFEILNSEISEDQKKALSFMANFIKGEGTHVQDVINYIVFKLLKEIVVYPVEDENKFADHFGNVLPDAILVPEGSTAYDLAMKIHTDIGNNMLYAVDAVKKVRLAKNYVLKDGDIIKIVSAAKR